MLNLEPIEDIMSNIEKLQIKEEAIANLAKAICYGEISTTEDEALDDAAQTWLREFHRHGFWPAVGKCESEAARYRDM